MLKSQALLMEKQEGRNPSPWDSWGPTCPGEGHFLSPDLRHFLNSLAIMAEMLQLFVAAPPIPAALTGRQTGWNPPSTSLTFEKGPCAQRPFPDPDSLQQLSGHLSNFCFQYEQVCVLPPGRGRRLHSTQTSSCLGVKRRLTD